MIIKIIEIIFLSFVFMRFLYRGSDKLDYITASWKRIKIFIDKKQKKGIFGAFRLAQIETDIEEEKTLLALNIGDFIMFLTGSFFVLKEIFILLNVF